ncbi:hypothetical protein ALP76_01627 [Pseudomonas savastanoi pv. glycinea]|uniref:Taurine catabolism dioxygenase n=1 Tax=Pseudomonas savastanoi pv. glycinea TaxID=318 RepID=A0A3M4YWN6_PSESG|nr:hypothetical protein [Pseudomonas savastanoi]MBN4178214.1 hypothetical protein [Pseudomonas savastanoi pv. phaseolicola]RMM64935.1 hypothetical protein ALQ73_01522 [Pseudomonas savastanoi pv. glycinea]RMR92859.1 hypothetical protein ALP76_01627 [Pseudomonas savastanoi pv. glycinea]
MIPLFTFEPEEKAHLLNLLEPLDLSPYKSYTGFSEGIRRLHSDVPARFLSACQIIRSERANHQQKIHVIRNCPMDRLIPELDPEDPVKDKHVKKTQFVSEAFLELFAQLTGTPLLSYETRNEGDFFTDVIAIKKYSGQLTGFSDSELVFHNDRTAHKVRADYITVTADAELTHVTTWRCPISIQPKVRPANALRSRSLGQRNFDTWVNSASAATSNGTENQRKAWLGIL